MDNDLLFKKLGIKIGRKVLNQNFTVGYKVTEESLIELKEFIEKIKVPKNTSELKKIVDEIQLVDALIRNISIAYSLDQSSGFMETNKFKLLKDLSLKAELKYESLMSEIKANISNYDVKGMPRFMQDMKYYEKYTAKNPNTRKTLTNMTEALEKASEVYHYIESDVDYGELFGKKVTKFDLMPFLRNNDSKIRKEAYRHFKEKKTASTESLYLLLSSMTNTRNEMSKLKGYDNAHDMICKTGLFMDEKVIYELYKLLKKKSSLKNRVSEVRRKLMKIEMLGAQDMYAPIFEEKEITLKESEKILEENLIEPLTQEWPKYREVYDNISLDITDKSDEKRRSGAWCAGLSNGKENSSIVYFGKYNNSLDSVRTIAHEMNHGVHNYLQFLQGFEINETGTPGYFNEAMAMQAENRMLANMIKNETDKNRKIELMLNKLEDSFASIYSQIVAHFMELGFYDGSINSFEEFEKMQEKMQKDFGNSKVDNHNDIKTNLIFRVHHFDYTLYCIKYVLAELMAAKLELMSFDKVASLAEDLTTQVGTEEVTSCFLKHGINIKGLGWIKEVFSLYEERVKELEKLV